MAKPIILDPDDSFEMIPESLGQDPPVFRLYPLTKKERDIVFSGPMMEMMGDVIGDDSYDSGDAMSAVSTGRISKDIFKAFDRAIADFSKKIHSIENISVVQDGNETFHESMKDRDLIKQVYEKLPMLTDVEIKMSVIGSAFMAEIEEARLK